MTPAKRSRTPVHAWSKQNSDQPQGQTMVEFALILPFLLVIIIGIMGFTLLFFSYVTMQNAVREGTSAIVHKTQQITVAEVRQIVISATVTLDRDSMHIDISPNDPSAWNSGVRVSVSGYYTVPLPTITIPTLNGSIEVIRPFQIHADSIMTIE